MKKLSMLLLSTLFLASILNAGYNQERKVLTSIKVLQDIVKAPKMGATQKMLQNAKAIAVFPNTMKSAFLIGGIMGSGVMSVRDENGKWSEPIFVKLRGLSAGLQIGFKATDIVMLFKTDRSLDGLANGEVTLGVDAGVVALARGTKQTAQTDGKLAANIRSFGRSSGYYIGASISGGTLSVNDNDDFDYYDDLVYIDDILAGDRIKDRPESRKFEKALNNL